jgi:hypothetical protein
MIFDFEDDDVGDDDWFACIYLTLVYDVRFGYGLKKLKLCGCLVMVFALTVDLNFNVCNGRLVFTLYCGFVCFLMFNVGWSGIHEQGIKTMII